MLLFLFLIIILLLLLLDRLSAIESGAEEYLDTESRSRRGKEAALAASTAAAAAATPVGYIKPVDIHPFVNRSKPVVQRRTTVGGLDKQHADSYWKAIRANQYEG